MQLRHLFQVLLCLLLLTTLAAQDPLDEATPPTAIGQGSVTLVPSTLAAGLGEPITITATLPAGNFAQVNVELPADQKRAFVVERPRRQTDTVYTFQLRALQPGSEVTFGPAIIVATPPGDNAAPVRIATAPLVLDIAAPTGEAADEIKPVTGPLALEFDYFWRNVIIGAAVLLGTVLLTAVATLLLVSLRKRAAQAALPPPLPPVEEALLGVAELKKLDEFRHQGAERHYTSLSAILRAYFEHQYGRPALEMSEDELIAMLRHDLSGIPSSGTLEPVLTRSSMAKFAKQPITEDTALADCRESEKFLLAEKQRMDLAAAAAASTRSSQGQPAASTTGGRS